MKYLVETHPCTVVHGTIDIPDDEKDPAGYARAHFDDIRFDTPALDFRGTELEVYGPDGKEYGNDI